MRELDCKNIKCAYFDKKFEQNCCAENDNGDPLVVSCPAYIPDIDERRRLKKTFDYVVFGFLFLVFFVCVAPSLFVNKDLELFGWIEEKYKRLIQGKHD